MQFRGKVIWEIFGSNTSLWEPHKLGESRAPPSNYATCYGNCNITTYWYFNRTTLPKISTKDSGASHTPNETRDNSTKDVTSTCEAPKPPKGRMTELGLDVFANILTPFLFLVAGYAMGLGVRFTTLFNASGGCDDRQVIPELEQAEREADLNDASKWVVRPFPSTEITRKHRQQIVTTESESTSELISL